MRLIDLMGGDPTPAAATAAAALARPVRGLTADSREVAPGWLFAALPGVRVDGRAFIDQAIGQGAVAVLAPPGTRLPGSLRVGRNGQPLDDPLPEITADAPVLIEDPEPRRRLALFAARFYGRQPTAVVAVTGTNGKTSVVRFAAQLWRAVGKRAASLGTLGLEAPDTTLGRAGALTTPDPVALHADLAALADAGIDCLAIEASSHGLAQHRLDGLALAAAGFTNLSRDHLDYHGTMAAYLIAKRGLFDRVLPPGGTAVINADLPEASALITAAAERGQPVIDYGVEAQALRVERVTPLPDGQRVALSVFGRPRTVTLGLVGRFQLWNALCALGLTIAADPRAGAAAGGAAARHARQDALVAALERLTGVPGRLERVARRARGGEVFVDYAHTPDALAAMLAALRPHVGGRLTVVIGAGGDRDAGKRPQMGHAATAGADRVIVTDDNPRTEDPAAIPGEILPACPGARDIGDRGEAIATAVAGLTAGDLLLVAGKGHESGQIIGTEVVPFDDAAVVRAAFAETAS